jgi:hypothetical protein
VEVLLDGGEDRVVVTLQASDAEGVDDTSGLTADGDTIVSVHSRLNRSKKGSKKRHVLDLVCAPAGDKSHAQLFREREGSSVISNETSLGVGSIVNSSDLKSSRAGNIVQQAELVERRTHLSQASGARHNALGPAPLAHIKSWVKHVTKRHAAGSIPGLKGLDVCDLAICILLLRGRPCLRGNVEIEGLGGVGEQLVGKRVCDLLDECLSSQVCRTGDIRQRDVLAKRQCRRLGRIGVLGWGHVDGINSGEEYVVFLVICNPSTKRGKFIEVLRNECLG